MSDSHALGDKGPMHYISRADEEKLVQRLYYQQMDFAAQRMEERERILRQFLPQRPQKSISKLEEERLVQRIYDQQLQRFQASKAEREKKVEMEIQKNNKTMSSAEIDEQVHRVYSEELERSRQRRRELEGQYVKTKETKKIPKSRLQDCVNRLSHVDYEKRDEVLFNKYVYPFDPKVCLISRSEEEAMASRLSTRKSGS